MAQFVHPTIESLTLSGVLNALADPIRLRILQGLLGVEGCMSCSEASPCSSIAKSTLSMHFRVLRDAGLIQTTKRGVENRNVVRRDDINARFPGLLDLVMKLAISEITPVADPN